MGHDEMVSKEIYEQLVVALYRETCRCYTPRFVSGRLVSPEAWEHWAYLNRILKFRQFIVFVCKWCLCVAVSRLAAVVMVNPSSTRDQSCASFVNLISMFDDGPEVRLGKTSAFQMTSPIPCLLMPIITLCGARGPTWLLFPSPPVSRL